MMQNGGRPGSSEDTIRNYSGKSGTDDDEWGAGSK